MAIVERATSRTGKQYLTNVLSVFEFPMTYTNNLVDGAWKSLGFYNSGQDLSGQNIYQKYYADFIAYIPENFTIKNAFITMFHSPRRIAGIPSAGDKWCYARKVKLYVGDNLDYRYIDGLYGSGYGEFGYTLSEVLGSFGIDGFTATPPSTYPAIGSVVEKVTSTELKNILKAGTTNFLRIQSGDTCTNESEEYQKTGQITATLTVIGYIK